MSQLGSMKHKKLFFTSLNAYISFSCGYFWKPSKTFIRIDPIAESRGNTNSLPVLLSYKAILIISSGLHKLKMVILHMC